MGNAISDADSYTEEYSAYESSRVRADDNDTWDYSMEESRGRIAPSESSSSHSQGRGRHRKSRSPIHKSRSRSPPRSSARNPNLVQSFSGEDDPTFSTILTDAARRDHKQPRPLSSSPGRALTKSPPNRKFMRSPYVSPRSSSSPPKHHYREHRQPMHYESDDSSEMEERDRRRLYRYGRDHSYDDYETTLGDEDEDDTRHAQQNQYDSKDDEDEESVDDRYHKRKSPRHKHKLTIMQSNSKEQNVIDEKDGEDTDYVSITDVSVELNPNRRLQQLRPQLSSETKNEVTREVDLIQLHEDQENQTGVGSMLPIASPNVNNVATNRSMLAYASPPSPIHLEHLPSPPISPQQQQQQQQQQQYGQQIDQISHPSITPNHAMVPSLETATTNLGARPQGSRTTSPQPFFQQNRMANHAASSFFVPQASPATIKHEAYSPNKFEASSAATDEPQSQLYAAVPVLPPNPTPDAHFYNERYDTTSPIPSVTAETYYGGSFHAIIDQLEMYPELHQNYMAMNQQHEDITVETQQAPNQAADDDNDDDSREPGGDHACDETVEHSLMTSPEEMMARNIIQARIRRALVMSFSCNESTEDSHSAPSASIRSRETFDNNGESAGSFDDNDIEFVRLYETVFDQFVNANLNLMARHPELIYNLRVAKLQKLFQAAADTESEVEDKIQAVDSEKRQLLVNHKKELIEAARRKAALEIQLRQELNSIEQATLEVTGKMTWQLIVANLTRANRHHQLIQNLSHTRVSCSTILEILPTTDETKGIRTALSTPPGRRLTDKHHQETRQLQVDNTFLRAEVSIMEKKLAALQTNAKKYAWVDSIFVRMDPKHVKKLKHRFQKNLGVSF